MKRVNDITIEFSDIIKSQLIKIAENALPNESAAILFGKTKIETKNNKKRIIYDIKLVEEFVSTTLSSIHFSIDEVELYEKWKSAEKHKLKLLSIFHSHLNYKKASIKDEIYMKNIDKLYPNWIWLIYINKTQDFKAYKWHKGKLYQVDIEEN